jgi:hypothetical protein
VTDCLFADVSEYQAYVNDSYPYPLISFRSNDGTYRDRKFAANLSWAKDAVTRGKILGFIVYFVYEPNWQETVATFKAMVGAPHPKMAVMIDVESWGRIYGDNSPQINAARESIITWLSGNRKRVIGYGNMGDLASLWPNKGDAKVVVAAYGSNPSHPAKIAHQFADNWNTPPFGPSDINSADGYSPQAFAAALGLVPTGSNPTGHLDAITAGVGTVHIRGWAFDADNKAAALPVRVYQDGKYLNITNANLARADVNKATGAPGNHGFDFTFPAATGKHTYTVYAMNIGGGANTVLGNTVLTVATPPTPNPIPGPNPFPFVPGKETEMIMVQTDPKLWPAGHWPGVFMLSNNTLKHIAHGADVTAYHAAGVPGVIVITIDEFNGYQNVTKAAPVVNKVEAATLGDELIPGSTEPTT